MNPAPVGFEFGFAGTAGADAAAQPGHRRAVAGQPRQQIVQLRQLHLQLAFSRAGAARENIQDQLRPVEHLDVQRFFQIALLRGRQLAVEDHRGRFVELDLRLQLFHFAGADEASPHRSCGRDWICRLRHSRAGATWPAPPAPPSIPRR